LVTVKRTLSELVKLGLLNIIGIGRSIVYKINSIVPFKKIFIEQYIFASKNYTVGY